MQPLVQARPPMRAILPGEDRPDPSTSLQRSWSWPPNGTGSPARPTPPLSPPPSSPACGETSPTGQRGWAGCAGQRGVPGWVKTEMDEADQASGGYTDADIVHHVPMGRFAAPRDIAAAVAFLADPERPGFSTVPRFRSTAGGPPTRAGPRSASASAERPRPRAVWVTTVGPDGTARHPRGPVGPSGRLPGPGAGSRRPPPARGSSVP
jgi:hypothetical protein